MPETLDQLFRRGARAWNERGLEAYAKEFWHPGEGSASGVRVDHVWAYRCVLSDGMIRRFRAYFDPEEALREAGIER